jgi:hypothetical protein
MTLAQIAEKPITVAIDDAINSFTDKRHGRRLESFLNQPFPAKSFLATSLCRPNSIVRSKPSGMRLINCCGLKRRRRYDKELTPGCRRRRFCANHH